MKHTNSSSAKTREQKMQKNLVSEVFNGVKTSKKTYIERDDGRYESELKQGMLEKGTLCLITGSSKTGKTSLCDKVLAELDKAPIRVRCSSSIKPEEFWNYPLEDLDFSRIKAIEDSSTLTTGISGSVSGKLGWEWFASLKGTLGLSTSTSGSEKEIKEAILAKPSPTHLTPLLKNSNAVLVVEDFHYLSEDVQREIFQQWKIFTDNEISVIVVGTTHHGVDLATANSDLIGRILHIDLGRWSDSDLEKIAKTGMALLGIGKVDAVAKLIAQESAGLPILTQQVCAQLFHEKGLIEVDMHTAPKFTTHDAKLALHRVARKRYLNFETWYNQLVQGPRIKSRKYDTYKIILALLSQDPPTFSLTRTQIDARLKATGLEPSQVPPAASINSTLASLEKFQKSHDFELLEWSKRDRTVYIVEPSFLFYLRWREHKPDIVKSIYELVMEIAGVIIKTHTTNLN